VSRLHPLTRHQQEFDPVGRIEGDALYDAMADDIAAAASSIRME
jgi:hypothetical protein